MPASLWGRRLNWNRTWYRTWNDILMTNIPFCMLNFPFINQHYYFPKLNLENSFNFKVKWNRFWWTLPIGSVIYSIISWSYLDRSKSFYDSSMIVTWSFDDRAMIRPWSCHGRSMIVPWSIHDRAMIDPWSCHDRSMIVSWSIHDQLIFIPRYFHDRTMIVPVYFI